jgi:hypothetical protein
VPPRSTIVLLLLLASPLAAQTTVEYQVKLGFLYKFANFVDWPAKTGKPNADSFHFCLLGEDPFGGTLQTTLEGKLVRERPVVVAHIFEAKDASGCQIVFIPKSQKNLRAILIALRGAGILTVGESEGFAAEGGVIGFCLEEGRVRLEINLQAAEQQQLQVSSKLLSLAQIVKKP